MRERNHKKVAAGTETKEDRKELSTRNELEVPDCTIERSCKEYYIEPVKIIRDLVHGYINLTSFELKLIDSTPLQRLKDISVGLSNTLYRERFKEGSQFFFGREPGQGAHR